MEESRLLTTRLRTLMYVDKQHKYLRCKIFLGAVLVINFIIHVMPLTERDVQILNLRSLFFFHRKAKVANLQYSYQTPLKTFCDFRAPIN